MHSLFATTQGSNPGPFDLKSDTNHYYTAPTVHVTILHNLLYFH